MKNALGIVLIGAIMFVVGVSVGESRRQIPEYTVDNVPADMAAFAETWNLLEMYFEPTPGTELPTTEKKVRGAIEGLVRSYDDPHSVFLVPELAKRFEENTTGEFGGVGMEIDVRDDVLVVVSPLKGTPADDAGLQPGDSIIGIDDESTVDISVDEAVQKIRGTVGTDVTLTILREGDIFDVTVTRDTITIPTIETEEIDDVFVIRLFNFSGTSVSQFEQAIQDFEASDADKLILDMRGNPGGYLDAAVEIASYFIEEGRPIVYEVAGEEEIAHRSKGYPLAKDLAEMVVLVNYGSASASEIVAGALQEYDIATLVGTETFGKGSVQQLLGLDADRESLLKLTIAQWYTPERNSISKNGLLPDEVVEVDFSELGEGEDPQFDRALELLE